MPELIRSDDIWEAAKGVFAQCHHDIGSLIPGADIQHTGSTAIRGALTKGDVDIQVRVNEAAFEQSKVMLGNHYSKHREELWTPTLALFHRDDKQLPVGIALVVAGSGQDEFDKLRDLMIKNPELLDAYNKLKRQHSKSSDKEYRAAKSAFFGPLGASHLL